MFQPVITRNPTVKVSLEGANEIRRFKLENDTFQHLHEKVKELFAVHFDLVVRYRDEDGDLITMSTDAELREAVSSLTGEVLRIEVKNNALAPVAAPVAVAPVAPVPALALSPVSGPVVVLKPVPTPEISLRPQGRSHFERYGPKDHGRPSRAEKDLDKDAKRLQRERERDAAKQQQLLAKEARRVEKEAREAARDRDNANKKGDRHNNLECRFVKDVTIEDGTEIPSASRFTKTWRLRNSGAQPWPVGCCLVFVGRDDKDRLGAPVMVEVNPNALVPPETDVEVSVNLVTPDEAGRYVGYWKMATATGRKFGQRLWVNVVVPTSSDEEAGSSVNAKSDPVELWSTQIASLNEMGFADVPPKIMVRLLEKHQGNISKVALALVKKQAALERKADRAKAVM